MMKNFPLVSITITTRNEEKNITNCLKSIKRQTYRQKKIETIVVDNNSIDKTKEIAKKYTNKVFDKGPERSAQRNFGMMKKSKGKYVMFLDADMILSPTVIEKAVNKLENSSFVALYIPEIILGNSFWSKVRRFERSFYDATVIDCVRFIKKDVFVKVGGFDESLTGPEDWDLDKKIRKLGPVALLLTHRYPETELVEGEGSPPELRNPCLYHNESEFKLKDYLAKKRYYIKNLNTYIKKWGKKDPDIKKQFCFYYRYFGVFLEKGKWKRLLKHPILALGILILKFLVGLLYFKKIATPLK